MEQEVISIKSPFELLSQPVTPMLESTIHLMDGKLMDYPWSSSSWESAFKQDDKVVRLIYVDNLIAGFSLYQVDDVCCHLLKIAIDHGFKGKRHGVALLTSDLALMKEHGLKTAFLEVACDNNVAIKLYEKLGFKGYHLAKKYYSDGCDALKMSLELLP